MKIKAMIPAVCPPAVLTLVVLMGAANLRADSMFITGEMALGSNTTFTDTVNGMTATFTNGGQVAWQTEASPFSWGPEALYGGNGNALEIDFSSPISSITMDFAIPAGGGNNGYFDLYAYLPNNTEAGSVTSVGSQVGSYYEGSITFSNPDNFNKIVLEAPSGTFGIGNVDAVTVPEPASVILFGTVIFGLASRFRRKKNRQIAEANRAEQA